MTFEVEVLEGEDAFLITGENYYPGWHAYINEREIPYYKTNFLLGGLYVPDGRHTVRLYYEPVSVKNGISFSLIGIALWVVLLGASIGYYRIESKESAGKKDKEELEVEK